MTRMECNAMLALALCALVLFVGFVGCLHAQGDKIEALSLENSLLRRKNNALSRYAEELVVAHRLSDAAMPRALEATYAGEFKLTSYCTERRAHICGTGDGITKSGAPVSNLTVAADLDVFPLGTVLYIDGVGIRVVQDTGGAIKGNHLDVAFEGSHDNALRWPLGNTEQKVWVLR